MPPYALTAVALFGSAVPMSWRRGLARAAGVLLVVVGLVTFARGLGGHEGRAGMDSNPHARHHSP